MTMNRLPTLVACAVAAPLVVVTVGMLAFAAAELSGRTPLAYDRPRNVAEAAGMANGSEVLRFLRAGEGPSPKGCGYYDRTSGPEHLTRLSFT